MERKGQPRKPVGAWVALGSFFLVVNTAQAIYWFTEMRMPDGVGLLVRAMSLLLIWNWLEQECRPYGQTYPLDMGLFLYTVGFLLIPYYMWRNQRWRGVVKIAALLGIWGGTWAFAIVAGWVVRARLE